MLFFVYSLVLIALLGCHDSDSDQTDTVPPPLDTYLPPITLVSPYYVSGREPDVAFADDGTVVQVHDNGSGELWYKVGEVKGPVIVWGKGDVDGDGEDDGKYDTGESPSVAFTDSGLVVEVHRSGNDSGLWYHVGEIQKTGGVTWIDWGPSYQIEQLEPVTPNDPSVAVVGTTVVMVHSYLGDLDYRVGILNTQEKTISWGGGACPTYVG
jgi:hypothetical protein